MKTLHRGEPRDADGDGFVDDGKPTMRPATRRTGAVWRRHPDGYMSRDGDWFLERGAPMAGGNTNSWMILRRAPADRIGTENGRHWDTRDGGPLWEVDGNLYLHEADAASLGEAKLTVQNLTAADVEDHREDYENAGYDAAAEKFSAVSVEQMRTARTRAREAVDTTPPGTPRAEALHGAIRWLSEHIDAADGVDIDPVPDSDPYREEVYRAERELLAPMDRMRAVTDEDAARIASEHVGEDVTILRTDNTLGGLEKGRHIVGVWLPGGPVIAVPPGYALSPFEVYHETAHLLTSRGDGDVRGHGPEFQREYLRILPKPLADRIRPGLTALPAEQEHTDDARREASLREGRPDATGEKGDPIDVNGDVERAASLIAQGKHVRLNRIDEIGTLVVHLARLVRMAEERGDDAPTYDLCKVSVPGTNLFCAQSKGIPRLQMPQLSGKPRPGSVADGLPRNERGNVNVKPLFRDWLMAHGVDVEDRTVRPDWLKATQHELDGPAVGRILTDLRGGAPRGSGTWATRDGYILDGHHQWAAEVALDADDNALGGATMQVHVIDMEIGEALELAREFGREQGITPSGIGADDTSRGPRPPSSAEQQAEWFEERDDAAERYREQE